MNTKPRFLSVEDVLLIHQDTMQHEGGAPGLRDPALLESAVMMPRQQFGGKYLHENMACMAAAYLFHIAQNHPFHDGNKRVAVMSALVFLDVNGIELLPETDVLEAVVMAVASSAMSKQQLTEWFGKQLGPQADSTLR